MSPQSAAMIVLGVIACFSGYSLFRTMLPLWGFILGGWIAFTMLPVVVAGPQANTLLFQAVAFVGGGIIGAVIAVPLYFLIIFLSGAALGGLFGVMFGTLIDVGGISTTRQVLALIDMSFPPIPQTGTQFLMMAIFAILLGSMSISFQKFMIIASSSFLGSAALISGMTGTIAGITQADMGRAAVIMIGWLVVGLIGMFVQFRVLGET